MIIESIQIISNNGSYEYSFSNKIAMIYSRENSKGKTTLVRMILYALGYQVPATEGIGDFSKFTFILSLFSAGEKYLLTRHDQNMTVSSRVGAVTYILPYDEDKMFMRIFGVEDDLILKNLLAVFYMDQEKGWTMLNRGKIIGNIRFNIEEFIAGLSGKDIYALMEEKNTLNQELKKYRYFKNVADINNEYTEYSHIEQFGDFSLQELLQTQKELQLKCKKLNKKIAALTGVINNNKDFASLICDFGAVIVFEGKEIEITKDNLKCYGDYQELLELKRRDLKFEAGELNKKIKRLSRKISEKNTLFSVSSILDDLEAQISYMNIDISGIEKSIAQLSNKRRSVNNKIKEVLLSNNRQLIGIYSTINKYATELGIKQYIIRDDPTFVLVNKLKGFSGRVLAQMAFVFKLAYINSVYDQYGVCLPIIIDSPRTNELSKKSTDSMMRILVRDFACHQIILASIYEMDAVECNIIDLNSGLMGY